MPLSTSNIDDTFTSREEGIKRLLSGILNLNLHHESNEKHIISVINRLLSTAKHRKEGLEYLNIVVDNCSLAIIAENAINWTSHCIIKFSDDVLRELKLRVLGTIIEVAHKESEFNKKFVSDYIFKVLDNCVTTSHVNPYECKAALKTLTTSMRYYPSSFGTHKQKIEDFLLIFLDSENVDLVQSSALAFHYLQQVGSAGANGMNHKLNFTQNFHKLSRTVHKLYDSFFENEKEIFRTERSSDDDAFQFQSDPSSNTQVLLHINARRIRNVLKFIEIMIKTKFPVAKETKPKELLEIISRGTSSHKCISSNNIETLESYQFSFLLSEIQCAVLKLLRLFIIWYEANCLPFSYSISKILVDSIERSHNCKCFKHDSLYQESSYRALSEWLALSKSSLHPQFQSQILICILKDVTPVKNQVTLTISEAASGKKSQKAKRRAMADRIISSGNQSVSTNSDPQYEKNEANTCKFALMALTHLLEFTKLNVKPALLKDFYKSIFDSLTTIQSSKPVHPYTDAQCRAKLYEVLVAIYHQNSLSILPPLQTSLDILSRGANDSNRVVSEISQRGLRNLETLCQPICPSLYLGAEREEIEDLGESQAEGVEDGVEIEEMIVGEDDQLSSVDYDASTDEYSPNVSVQQNSSSDKLAYEVKQPDSDSSMYNDTTDDFPQENMATEDKQWDTDASIEDDLNDEGTSKKDEFEEPNQNEEEIEKSKNSPAIFISSDEDENEALKSVDYQIPREFEEVKIEEYQENQQGFSGDIQQEDNEPCSITENLLLQDESKKEDSTEKIADTAPMKDLEVKNIEDETTAEESQNKLDEENILNTSEENIINAGEEIILNIDEENPEKEDILTQESGIKDEVRNLVDSTSLPNVSDGPPTKKARLSDDDLELGDKFDEQTENKLESRTGDEQQDSNDLEDDSFVDEVKDYY